MRHGTDHPGDTPKPHPHRRFPGPFHLLRADPRWQGICRVCLRLHPLDRLPACPQDNLYGWWLSNPSLPLGPSSPGWPHHLAYPVHFMPGGFYRLATFRFNKTEADIVQWDYGSWPSGLPKMDGANALSGAGSLDTATTPLSKTSRTKKLDH